MMAEPTFGKIFKQLSTATIFSELKGLGLKATLSGKNVNSFSIDPYHPKNRSAFRKLAGSPQEPVSKVPAIRKAGDKLPIATRTSNVFAQRNALAALNSDPFAELLQKHGYAGRVVLTKGRLAGQKREFRHMLVFEKK